MALVQDDDSYDHLDCKRVALRRRTQVAKGAVCNTAISGSIPFGASTSAAPYRLHLTFNLVRVDRARAVDL
jgi:hypothetical protein